MSADQRKDLPPASNPGFLDAVREVLSGYLGKRGDPLNRGVTLRDLSDAGMVELSPGYLQRPGTRPPIVGPGPNVGSGGGSGSIEPDLTPPPMPSGVVVAATFSALIMQHAAPIYTQGHGHARTKVYGAIRAAGAPQPVFGDAVEITQFVGNIFAHPTTLGTTWHLWFTWISQDGVESTVPAGGANGFVATTGRIGNADLGPLIVEAGNLAAAAVDLGSSKVTGTITDPVRFGAVAVGYTVTQYLVATSGLLANLRVDDAQMVSVSADKLLAGAIQVGRHIQSADFVPGTSGWVIRGNGTAEFAAASIRGKITANQFDGRGARIEDDAGNLILGAGNALLGSSNLCVNGDFRRGSFGFNGYAWQGDQSLSIGPNSSALFNLPYMYLQAGSDVAGNWGFEVLASGIAGGWPSNTDFVLSFYAAGNGGFIGSTFWLAWNVSPDDLAWILNPALSGAWQRYAVRVRRGATNDSLWAAIGGGKAGNFVIVSNVQVELGLVCTSWSAAPMSAQNPINASNVSTYIANAAIGAAQVGVLSAANLTVGAISQTVNGGAGSGQNRIVMNTNEFVFWNASNVARIRMIP